MLPRRFSMTCLIEDSPDVEVGAAFEVMRLNLKLSRSCCPPSAETWPKPLWRVQVDDRALFKTWSVTGMLTPAAAREADGCRRRPGRANWARSPGLTIPRANRIVKTVSAPPEVQRRAKRGCAQQFVLLCRNAGLHRVMRIPAASRSRWPFFYTERALDSFWDAHRGRTRPGPGSYSSRAP